ncbi:MAG: hypothetical protein ACKVY0_30325 [Prosthecobacter sp.]|uniref:hypothetical protein n=1 Tax=Prosthecobacter sp. TaxID=1965333 RepID=UPI0038FEBC14
MFPLLCNICRSASSLLTLAGDGLVETGWAAMLIRELAGLGTAVKQLHHRRPHISLVLRFGVHGASFVPSK